MAITVGCSTARGVASIFQHLMVRAIQAMSPVGKCVPFSDANGLIA